jgi:hypothetical protein
MIVIIYQLSTIDGLLESRVNVSTQTTYPELGREIPYLLENLKIRNIEASCLRLRLRGPTSIVVPRSFATDFFVACLRVYHNNGLLADRHFRGGEELGRFGAAFISFHPATRMLALQRISQLISYYNIQSHRYRIRLIENDAGNMLHLMAAGTTTELTKMLLKCLCNMFTSDFCKRVVFGDLLLHSSYCANYCSVFVPGRHVHKPTFSVFGPGPSWYKN